MQEKTGVTEDLWPHAELNVLNERMMAEACRARGCQFFWVLQPNLARRGEAMTPFERDTAASRHDRFWQSLDHYYQEIRELVQADAGFWTGRFLDLSCPSPDVAGSFFSDTVHLTDAGANRSAEYLATLILTDLASRAGEAPPLTTAVAQGLTR